MILKQQTVEELSKELSLPFTGSEQDWDIEMANSKRISDFINFYEQNDLSIDKKVALMSLIIASYDDFLHENDFKIDDKWLIIKDILESEIVIFFEIINYWALYGETEKDNLFSITPLMRNLG